MDALVVVDMQVGLRDGPPKHDLDGVVGRINRLARLVRRRSGKVVWIQHCGKGDAFAPGAAGWPLLPELEREPADPVVHKTLNDAFAGTSLQTTLVAIAPRRLLVAGWATDFCVDATVRSAVSHHYDVVVVGDGHTLGDRPHLEPPAVIRHHHWVWSNLITTRTIRIASTAELLAEGEAH
jgi:nicotinamidase-related amidase